MRTQLVRLLTILLFGSLSAIGSHAGVIVYTGTDVGVGPGAPTPNADAAAASFDAAAALIGASSLITFEDAPVGTFSNLAVAPGVTIDGADQGGNPMFINNVPAFPPAPELDGFNTTPGGANYVELIGGTLTFTFANPTEFFGAYLTGVQNGFYQARITFADSSGVQTIDVLAPDFAGGVTFIGFTDAGQGISSIAITGSDLFGGGDYLGVDDVRFQAVPEPSSLALAGLGLACSLLGIMTRRKASNAG